MKSKKGINKYRVIEPYFDAQLNKEMSRGEEVSLDDSRAKKLIDLRLIKVLERT